MRNLHKFDERCRRAQRQMVVDVPGQWQHSAILRRVLLWQLLLYLHIRGIKADPMQC